MTNFQRVLKEINEAVAVCWHCRVELSESEVLILKRDGTIQVDLCHDCYEFVHLENER
ncbi:hypothetical protein [Halobacillus sp. BBL2006]|uniref:hypothetical protein n=1 Tax=Halobacillus sp. BBL2006 TaxID=1543706 RepID=UPI000A4C1286|nr:hypothetical protein [Halobacillus sp. BBL2006]